ncbi:MAG: prepilin-type N-terminal cleavage/methylation domain-containing protein [Candidatus Riflebacteria bacterium]|nr:prepilin-type N-terminal cleavage/methylation domain-containing protein [Candidatus Riflebacteria bacterium]
MSRKAITLIEILIAIAVFLVAIIPLWGLMGSSHQQVIRSADEIKISQIAIEVLEQIENNNTFSYLPEEGVEKEFNLQSGGVISLGEEPSIDINLGIFDDYLMPKLYLFTLDVKESFSDEVVIGRIVSLTIDYKSKEGRDLSYTLRGFVSANN